MPDPVYFYEDIKVIIQQIGFVGREEIKQLRNQKTTIYKTGEKLEPVDFTEDLSHLLFERTDHVSSCAYFYLNTPGMAIQNQ